MTKKQLNRSNSETFRIAQDAYMKKTILIPVRMQAEIGEKAKAERERQGISWSKVVLKGLGLEGDK